MHFVYTHSVLFRLLLLMGSGRAPSFHRWVKETVHFGNRSDWQARYVNVMITE